MKHFASPSFWKLYRKLPKPTKQLADKTFGLLKRNPDHPSLHFKRVRKYSSVRVGIKYRALAVVVLDRNTCGV